MLSQEVTLTKASEHVCWIETIPESWIFLAPLGQSRALLQAMVPVVSDDTSLTMTNLLEKTRVIQAHVSNLLGSISVLEAFPQILDPLCGPEWIAVGDAALSVDPISGDGTGYGVRGAILAASVIKGITSGMSSSDCLRHYTLRLHKTFLSHIKQCFKYYSVGFSSPTWSAEVELMRKAWSSTKYYIENAEKFVYRLENVKLAPLTSSENL